MITAKEFISNVIADLKAKGLSPIEEEIKIIIQSIDDQLTKAIVDSPTKIDDMILPAMHGAFAMLKDKVNLDGKP